MRLLSYLASAGGDRLAIAIGPRDAVDASSLLGDGPWTMERLLADTAVGLARLRSALSGEVARARIPLGSVHVLPPIRRPGKIVAVGRNYREHAAEESARVPEEPLVFAKLSSSVIGPDDAIRWSSGLAAQVDYEAELAVVVGKPAREVSVAEALDYVLGYTCLNDVSARDLQTRDGQWTRAKSLDTFCPMGPRIVTADEIPDPGALAIRCRVNGALRQDSSTAEMIHGVAALVSWCSRSFTLEPGDVIATGTPGGVGAFRDPPVFLADGDVVEVEIDGIGTLRNRCAVVA
jgi:5-carboxymethyl-2-hydroxymuconate isomerase